ncbi:MAG: DUF2817 domain-containing protein, partial [Gammaproteobacteria bacterium]|nr:DUF2817 domain-containing protein [Gammaproteobacteria bacterium]
MGSGQYFHRSYVAVRGAFRDAVTLRGGEVLTCAHPSTGPAGEPLATDVARLGDESASRVLLLVTGVHGVEGYCGAGALIGWLQSDGPEGLPDNVAVVLVNLINPYGTAWLRRVNENNVDINRNFVDHGKAYRANPEYEALHDALLPANLGAECIEAANRRGAEDRGGRGGGRPHPALPRPGAPPPRGAFL